MRLAAVALALAGCALDRDPTWDLRVGLPPQTVARADLGVVDDAELAPGDVWVSIGVASLYGDDVSYPVVGAGASLSLTSAFDPSAAEPRGAAVLATALSKDGGEDHPSEQYAAFALAIHGPRASGRSLAVELAIPVGRPCDAPPVAVRGTFTPCGDCAAHAIVRTADGGYVVGPLHATIEVLPQDCAVTR